MKKRLLLTALAAVMLAALLPTNAFAAEDIPEMTDIVLEQQDIQRVLPAERKVSVQKIPEATTDSPVMEEYTSSSGTCGDNLTWTLNDSGTLTISGAGAMTDYASLTDEAPWKDLSADIKKVVIKSGVTSIGEYAFYRCANITEFSIPSTVTSIGDSAFMDCDALTAFALPNTVTHIGEYLFDCCDELKSVTIGSGIIELSVGTFSMCPKLTEVNLPEGLKRIDSHAFYDCRKLEHVSLPSTVTEIEGYAFRYCTSLKGLHIPAACTTLGSYIFDGCTSLAALEVDSANKAYKSANNVLFTKDGTRLIYAVPNITGEYTIPGTVTTIDWYAFENCQYSSIAIPASVTDIGYCAFLGCDSLTNMTVANSNPKYLVKSGTLCRREGADIILVHPFQTGTSYTVPSGITKVDWYAFYQNTTLVSLTFPEGITEIGCYAVEACTKLTTVSLPSTLKKLDHSAFYGCYKLDNLALPPGLEYIGEFVFCNCNAFVLTDIPDSVTYIGQYAFICTYLENHLEDDYWIVSDWLLQVNENVPFDGDTLTLPNTFTKMACNCFVDCVNASNKVHTIVIPKGVKLLSGNPFFSYTGHDSGLRNITKIEVASGNQYFTVANNCLMDKNKTTVYSSAVRAGVTQIPEGVKAVADYACVMNRARNLTLPSTLTTIGCGAFADAWALREIAIPNGVDKLDYLTFHDSDALAKVHIPGSVKEIAFNALAYCNGDTDDSDGNENLTIYGRVDSFAKTFADERGYRFAEESPFTDVKSTNWYYTYVMYAYDNGLMSGMTATTFEPNTPLTRAMVAQILYSDAGKPAADGGKTFSDVKEGDWYYDAVKWASANDIVSGYENGTFRPKINVTREQLAVILYAHAGKPKTSGSLSGFTDYKNVSDWAKTAMLWATQNGIIGGTNTGALNPKGNATRAEAAVMFMKYLGN